MATERVAFTQMAVERMKPPAQGRVIVWDKLVPGLGLRLSAPRPGSRDGRKVWIAMYRVGGKPVMETLGTVAQLPKVERAREAARASIMRAKAGGDPVAERRAAAAQAEKAAEEAATGRFDAVAERYLREAVERNTSASHARETRRIIEHDLLPRWRERPIRTITRHDVNDLLDAKASGRERTRKGRQDGAGTMANRIRQAVRRLFVWAIAAGLADDNPAAGVLPRTKEKSSDRVLDDTEIKAFWRATGKLGMPFGPLFRLMLLTAQRESEVGGMRWSEIDLDALTWTIPGERTKNRKPHAVHLGDLARDVLAAVPQIVGQDLLFSTTSTTPVSGFSRAKQRLDAEMEKALRGEDDDEEEEAAETAEAVEEGPSIAPWVLHDLRRTAATGMARLGIAPHVADRVLNHQAGTIRGVAAVYNRFAYLDERKAALDAWVRHVESLIRSTPSNVVPLTAAR